MYVTGMRFPLFPAAAISSSANASLPPSAMDHQAAFCRGALRTALAARVNTDNPILLEAAEIANAKLRSADAKLVAYLKPRIALLDSSKLIAAEQEGSRAQTQSETAVAKCVSGNKDLQSQATLTCMERAAAPTDACADPKFLPQA